MLDDEQDIFHIMKTNRPMRRLKPAPVAQDVLPEILDAASCAPDSMNTQPYKFLIVRERETKAFFGERYDKAMRTRFERFIPDTEDNSR